jgi:hypothetical protein
MPDSVTFEITLNLQDLAAYRQISEDDWDSSPITFTQAVVDRAAHMLVEQLATDDALRQARDKAVRMIAADYAADRVRAVLEQPVRSTNAYGEPTGPETSVTELIDKEIKKQLVRTDARHDRTSVLEKVIRETVNARLEVDLRAAFDRARTEMLDAAAEVGKKALQAAVSKAFT